MTAIIPIPAFVDNYIWLLRDGGMAAVIDPGDAAPVLAYLERGHLELAFPDEEPPHRSALDAFRRRPLPSRHFAEP